MGRLLGTIIHRIKWIFIFILVIFGYLVMTGGNVQGAADTIGHLLAGVAGGLITVIKDVLGAIAPLLKKH